jgi:hypothetical protein
LPPRPSWCFQRIPAWVHAFGTEFSGPANATASAFSSYVTENRLRNGPRPIKGRWLVADGNSQTTMVRMTIPQLAGEILSLEFPGKRTHEHMEALFRSLEESTGKPFGSSPYAQSQHVGTRRAMLLSVEAAELVRLYSALVAQRRAAAEAAVAPGEAQKRAEAAAKEQKRFYRMASARA